VSIIRILSSLASEGILKCMLVKGVSYLEDLQPCLKYLGEGSSTR